MVPSLSYASLVPTCPNKRRLQLQAGLFFRLLESLKERSEFILIGTRVLA